MPVPVTFYYEKDSTEVFAVFPDQIPHGESQKNEFPCLTCYSHRGQHSICDMDYVKECKKATPKDYEGLKRELAYIGYDLNILNENL